MRIIVHSAAIRIVTGPGGSSTRYAGAFHTSNRCGLMAAIMPGKFDAAAAKAPPLRIEIVRRRDDTKGCIVLPRRWLVERSFSWFGRNRRLAKDFENLAETLASFVTLASSQLALRRRARA